MSHYVLLISARAHARLVEMEALEEAGIEVRATAQRARALASVRQRRPDLVLLDLDLWPTDGMDVCRDLWQTCHEPRLPVMLMGGGREVAPRLAALEAGVEAFQPLPVTPRELVLRISAILRRVPPPQAADPASAVERLAIGPVTAIAGQRSALFQGSSVALTATERRLLLALARSGERIRSRAELTAVVWGQVGNPLRHRLSTQVRRLRAKLGGADCPIETVRGRGYRVRPGASLAA